MTYLENALLLEFGQQSPVWLKLVSQKCQLVGNVFGYLVQLLLAVLAFSALIVKKLTEKEQRTWKHWSFDTSKQALGSVITHFGNLAISYWLLDASLFTDPCVFYEVSFLVDTIFGTILNIIFVKSIEYFDAKYWHTSNLQSGYYGRPIKWSVWGVQTGVWLGICVVVKLILLYGVVIPAIAPLYAAGAWLMSPFKYHPKWELVMVMVIIPLVMNSLVFWNTDAWIMNTQHVPGQEIDDLNDDFDCLKKPKEDDDQDRKQREAVDPGAGAGAGAGSPSPRAAAAATASSSKSLLPSDGPTSDTVLAVDVVQSGFPSSSAGAGGGGGGGGAGAGTQPPQVAGRLLAGAAPVFVLRGGSSTSKSSSSSSSSAPSAFSRFFFGRTPSVTPAQKIRQTDYHRF